MPRGTGSTSELTVLAERLQRRLGNQRLASQALRTIATHAPDERFAMAFILKLAEDSTDALKSVLRNRAAANDLIFCLGSSELIATELTYAGFGWAAAFEEAREANAQSLIASMHSEPIDAPDRLSASIALARFNRRMFVQVAIADLLDRITVEETWRAMSALADECIRAALELATRFMGERAQEIGRFCVLAMGKLGAQELNLSSDIDLIYLHEPTSSRDSSEAAARLAESLTEMLSP